MKNNIKFLVIALTIFICGTETFASNTSGEEELATFANPEGPGADPGTTPINDYLIPMLLLGVLVGYRLTKLNLKDTVLKK